MPAAMKSGSAGTIAPMANSVMARSENDAGYRSLRSNPVRLEV